MRSPPAPIRLLVPLLFLALAGARCEPERTTPVAEPDPLARVAVVGASASAGFGAFLPGEAVPVSLDRAILAALEKSDGRAVAAHASPFFFTRPHQFGPELLRDALASDPTLLVAVDYLFWFCYGTIDAHGGRMDGEEERLETLGAALRLLERHDGPLVVGDIPDMSPAIGIMLSRAQVPRPGTIERANRRIREWAAGRDNVILFPLDDLTRQIRSGEKVRLAGLEWTPGEARRLLQPDRLHPSIEGEIATAMILLRLLDERSEQISPLDYHTDPDRVRDALTPDAP